MTAVIPLTSCSENTDATSSSSSSASAVSSQNTQMSVLSPTVPGLYNIREMASEAEQKWIYGAEGQDGSVQGDGGWYYMYTEETNTGGDYDVSKIKECWYSDINDGGSLVSSGSVLNKPTWVAGIYSPDTDIVSTDNWWNQSMDEFMSMTLNPSVGTGPYASAVLAFKAPQDGNYNIDVGYYMGNNDPYNLMGDGITLSIYAGSDKLYSYSNAYYAEYGHEYLNATLRAGEYIYIISDPNINGINDICSNISAEITMTFPKYADNSTVWAFGGGYINGDGTTQGENGWYYLFSEETNTGGIYDTSKIEECFYKSDYKVNPYTEEAFGSWLPTIYSENIKFSYINQWQQSADGTLSPEMYYPPYASAIIGWKAPDAGRYSINLSLSAGAWSDNTLYDGVTVSVYCGTRKVCGKLIEKTSDFIYSFDADMEENEYLYLIVDPNNTAVDDLVEGANIVIEKAD